MVSGNRIQFIPKWIETKLAVHMHLSRNRSPSQAFLDCRCWANRFLPSRFPSRNLPGPSFFLNSYFCLPGLPAGGIHFQKSCLLGHVLFLPTGSRLQGNSFQNSDCCYTLFCLWGLPSGSSGRGEPGSRRWGNRQLMGGLLGRAT